MIYQHDVDRALANTEVDFNLDALRARYKTLTGQDMPVTLRRDLARPLTTREMDANFQGLDQALMRAEYGDGPYPVFDQVFGANARFLDPRITHTRPGKSWRTVNGVLREYDVNEPCLMGDGLSLRPAETNLAYPSENLQSSRWTKINASAASATDLIEDSSLAAHSVLLPVAGQSYTSGKKYTFMADVEPLGAGSKRYLQIILPPDAFGDVADTWAMIDPTDGSVVHKGNALSVQVDPLAGGVLSVNVTATAVATVSSYGINLALALTPVRSEVYQGDGASGLKIHRVMLSEGDPKPYIPTTDSAVTRPADSALIQGDAFAEVFNPMEGAIIFDFDVLALGTGTGSTRLWQFEASDQASALTTYLLEGEKLATYMRPTNGGPNVTDKHVVPASLDNIKLGYAWIAGEIKFFCNGVVYGSASGISLSLIRKLYALSGPDTSAPTVGTLSRRLTIFNQRPGDAQMGAWLS